MMPENIAKKIDKWREATIKWHQASRKGDAPKYTPGWR